MDVSHIKAECPSLKHVWFGLMHKLVKMVDTSPTSKKIPLLAWLMRPSMSIKFNKDIVLLPIKVNFNKTCTYLLLKHVKTLGPLETFKGKTHYCSDDAHHKFIQKTNQTKKKTLYSHEMKEDPTIAKLKFSSLGHEQTMKILFILYFRMMDGYGPWFKINAHVHTHTGIEYMWTSYAFLELVKVHEPYDRFLSYSPHITLKWHHWSMCCFGCYPNYIK